VRGRQIHLETFDMTKPSPTIADLRAEAASHRQAWAKIPQADILKEIRDELTSPEIKALIDRLRPMQLALDDADPLKVHVGNIMNILTGTPAMLDQRLAALSAH
jgi:hypothetical protein